MIIQNITDSCGKVGWSSIMLQPPAIHLSSDSRLWYEPHLQHCSVHGSFNIPIKIRACYVSHFVTYQQYRVWWIMFQLHHKTRIFLCPEHHTSHAVTIITDAFICEKNVASGFFGLECG